MSLCVRAHRGECVKLGNTVNAVCICICSMHLFACVACVYSTAWTEKSRKQQMRFDFHIFNSRQRGVEMAAFASADLCFNRSCSVELIWRLSLQSPVGRIATNTETERGKRVRWVTSLFLPRNTYWNIWKKCN